MKPEKRKPTPAMAVSDVKRRKTDKAAGNHPNRGLAARSISDSVQSQKAVDSEKSISNVETLPKDVKPYPSEMRRAIQTVCNATGIDQKPEPSIIYGTDDFAVEEKSNEENAVESGGTKAKDKKKMKSTARPQQKIKVKKDEVGINRLLQNNVVMRLNGLAHYEVAKEIIVRSVARDKMSTKYGGSSQRFCPTIGPKFRHGHRFIFPTLGNNPDAPREPGKLGLLYRTTNERPWIEDPTKPKKKKTGPPEPKKTGHPESVKLFVGFKAKDFRYLGEYIAEPTTPLTLVEYSALSYETKVAWAALVSNREADKDIRTRIGLLKQLNWPAGGPTQQQVEQYKDTKFEVDRSDIIRAYSEGHEKFYIFQLICVGFDTTFNEELKAIAN